MAEMHAAFRRELDGVNESLRQMRDHYNAAGLGGGQDQQGGGQGGRGQVGNQEARTTVKAIGDIHRTLQSICRAPDLSHANLADFDQWSQEMMHTIETARTNDPQYNRINIEFIYGSIDLELRDQVEGHVPSKMDLINMTTPENYLLALEKLYTPADHLSTKRSEFEGWRQLPTESPMAYLAVMYRLYTRAKYNDQAFLVEKFLAGLLNEALKLQIVMHHRTANDYEMMRGAVVECHASMVKAVRVGKGSPPFSLTGLTQQSDTASQETYTQWKRRAKMGNPKEGESMDMARSKGPLTTRARCCSSWDLTTSSSETWKPKQT